MGPSIIIPLLVIAVVVPVALTWAKKQFKDGGAGVVDEVAVAPSARLTSTALRELPSPPWRVVYVLGSVMRLGSERKSK